jgi:hypothetical protein
MTADANFRSAPTMIATCPRSRCSRRGAIAAIVGVLLVVLIGMVACAFDAGWIAMTRAQLHAAADAAALAGGTELMQGLGVNATATPADVQTAATAAAVEFAGRNPNGDRQSCYCDGGRDVILGTAIFDPDAGQWIKTPGAVPYNYVQANLLRNQGNSGAGDGSLPLFFSRIFAIPNTPVTAFATAVILPANGIYIEEGSDDTAGLLPFAFKEEIWRKFEIAHDYYHGDLSHPNFSASEIQNLVNNPPDPAPGEEAPRANTGLGAVSDEIGQPLFGVNYEVNTGPAGKRGWYFYQLFHNEYTVSDDGDVTSGPDDQLEIDIYPNTKTSTSTTACSGNFGTIDFGNTNNSTQTLVRQITSGLNADDLSYYEGNQITISEEDQLAAEGDTGISGGISSALRSIIGDCRAIVLFRTTNGGSGNNCVFTLVEMVGATIVEVDLSTNNEDKRLFLQRCAFSDDSVIADTDEEINENTTVFTPLILIE